MPLQDHFRPPLSTRRHWHSFQNAWATYISSALNERLPAGYFAEANVQFASEIDVAAFEEAGRPEAAEGAGTTAVATAKLNWAPPAPVLTLPFTPLAEIVEIVIFSGSGGPTLAGAVELVSPANKDRPATREALVSKCAAYLQQGVGLVLVDVVTERAGNLHDELLARLGTDAVSLGGSLYATAYRPVERGGKPSLDVWQEALALGQPLPTLPLWLRGGLCLPVELESAYERTCREQRVSVNGP
ncbi:MAG TPA: DUF4058 family protein [Gemmataceae bacterium]|nr:DUF4058 family protein [Gemmataceae bacterium]